MENGLYTTKVKTQDGNIYDLGERQYPPTHYHPGNYRTLAADANLHVTQPV